MVIDRAFDSPRQSSKPPKVGNDQKRYYTKRDALRTVLPSRRKYTLIEDVRKHQYREVQRRKLKKEGDINEEHRRSSFMDARSGGHRLPGP